MTTSVEGGKEEMVEGKDDSSGMSWTVAMAAGCLSTRRCLEMATVVLIRVIALMFVGRWIQR